METSGGHQSAPPKRRYTMGERARSVEATRRTILDATANLATERRLADLTLRDVADLAGVSVQTVLRQFGSRSLLIDATAEHVRSAVIEERRAPVGDVAGAVAVIVAHYEDRGDAVLLLLAQEGTDAQVRTIVDRGKAVHREWVATVFEPFVHGADRLIDLLVVATDVYTWKLLRRDRGLSRSETEQRINDLTAAVIATVGTEST